MQAAGFHVTLSIRFWGSRFVGYQLGLENRFVCFLQIPLLLFFIYFAWLLFIRPSGFFFILQVSAARKTAKSSSDGGTHSVCRRLCRFGASTQPFATTSPDFRRVSSGYRMLRLGIPRPQEDIFVTVVLSNSQLRLGELSFKCFHVLIKPLSALWVFTCCDSNVMPLDFVEASWSSLVSLGV